MPQLPSHRVALRAAQLAIAAAGILILLVLLSKQAHAETTDEPPGTSTASSAVSAVTGAVLPGSTPTTATATPTPTPASLATAVTGARSAAVGDVTGPLTQ